MKVNELLTAMTLDEKLTLMHGQLCDPFKANQAGHVAGIPRMGIPDVFLADGESGVDVLWDATAMPAKVSLAATFSPDAAYRYGQVLGRETKAAGMHVLLSARVNIARDPLAQIGASNGGNFQTLSEDPLLNGKLVVSEVRGIEEDHNAIANLKQFFGSSTGTSQGAENSVMDEQTMREIYLWPFEMVIRAGVGSMMTSYNQVNGTWTYRWTELLEKVARAQWGFDGILVNDWCCLYSVKAAKGGVTLEMPEDTVYGSRLRHAVEQGEDGITEADVDRCVSIYLHTLQRFGMLDKPRVPGPIGEEMKLRHIPVARELSARGAVLLKNDGVLPLAESARIAVIGPGGRSLAMPVFKESAFGFADRKQSPLQALRELTDHDIPFAEGCDMEGETIPSSVWENLTLYRTRYESDPMERRDLDRLPAPMEGTEKAAISMVNFCGDNALAPLLKPDEYYLFHGALTPPESGWYRLGIQTRIPDVEAHTRNGITNADMFCFTSGNLYLKDAEDDVFRCIGIGTRTAMNGGVVANSDVVPCTDGWNNAAGFVRLEAGRRYEIAATATNLYHNPVEVRLNWSRPSRRRSMVEEAAALAAAVDVPVVFVWQKSPTDTLELKEEQNELIERIADVNPRTVVVVNSGDPVAMPWLDKVSAVLEMWFPGQEGGYATADVLLGRTDPGGRLPVTFPKRVEDTAPHAPGHLERCAPCGKVGKDPHQAENTAILSEGVNVGYRWLAKEGIKPLFPFGYGLSYTTFAISLDGYVKCADGGISLHCAVSNTGSRDGVCVLQSYLGRPTQVPDGVQAAEKALAAFTSVQLVAGETQNVELSVMPESLMYWDTGAQCRKPFEGQRKLWVGFSSEDLPIEIEI